MRRELAQDRKGLMLTILVPLHSLTLVMPSVEHGVTFLRGGVRRSSILVCNNTTSKAYLQRTSGLDEPFTVVSLFGMWDVRIKPRWPYFIYLLRSVCPFVFCLSPNFLLPSKSWHQTYTRGSVSTTDRWRWGRAWPNRWFLLQMCIGPGRLPRRTQEVHHQTGRWNMGWEMHLGNRGRKKAQNLV